MTKYNTNTLAPCPYFMTGIHFIFYLTNLICNKVTIICLYTNNFVTCKFLQVKARPCTWCLYKDCPSSVAELEDDVMSVTPDRLFILKMRQEPYSKAG